VAEVAWWDSCTGGLLWAEVEQMEMARRMGLEVDDRYTIHTSGTLWDVGGGPLSLLLKATGWDRAVVIDPAVYPLWTKLRYEAAGIEVMHVPAEQVFVTEPPPDEVWIYNTLQHVEDPQTLVKLAVAHAPLVRLFEWVEQGTNECHIHTLHAEEIGRWAREAEASVTEGSDTLNGVPYYAGVFTR
jgi:hypothetical protein